MPRLLRAPARDYVNDTWDSARWQAFTPRADDIVVNTPPKSGTTWTQGILALLLSGDPGVNADPSMRSPWIDIAVRPVEDVMARLEAQDHRRHVKSHTPFDGIPIWEGMRYVAVYRHPLDVHFSYRKHNANMVFDLPEKRFTPENGEEAFRLFVDGDHEFAASLLSIAQHYLSVRALDDDPAVLRLHYADMTRDLPGAMARIADHIGVAHPPEVMDRLVEAATFDSMKANADRFTPSAGQGFWKEDAGFFDSATSRKWEGRLSAGQIARYEARLRELVPDPEARAWLEWGGAAA
ncbi:sulfotransferase domain-containing protein [Jannaschia seohaensis]|uniref:Aryl sulfotransferase n=1 Tax=Jannaschia seohaensis TaxID=475081 RepID=A0A2Y9AU08_9RHOB|nr:sulfotransferase domain-containing protein [Jannaschia seohaensis]PWJ18293.1 aryl sulfotransferase [Jannaschia seohaensis]SSA46818.1 aryl sulfotransferase [Jannaschia seohaensis]